MSMISELVDKLRAESKSMGKYGIDYVATLLMRSADTIEILSEKTRESNKLIEAYSQDFKDGADEVKDIKDEPQTCFNCKHNVTKHTFDHACDGCANMNRYEREDEQSGKGE